MRRHRSGDAIAMFPSNRRAGVRVPTALCGGIGQRAGSPAAFGDAAEHVAIDVVECGHLGQGLTAA